MNSLDRSRKEYDLFRSRLGLWTCLERLGIVDASYAVDLVQAGISVGE